MPHSITDDMTDIFTPLNSCTTPVHSTAHRTSKTQFSRPNVLHFSHLYVVWRVCWPNHFVSEELIQINSMFRRVQKVL